MNEPCVPALVHTNMSRPALSAVGAVGPALRSPGVKRICGATPPSAVKKPRSLTGTGVLYEKPRSREAAVKIAVGEKNGSGRVV